MINAEGVPQHLLVLGGGSEIGVATARAWVSRGTRSVTLAARPGSSRDAAAATLSSDGAQVRTVDFDALDASTYATAIDQAAEQGDIDVAVVAFGVLGDQERAWQDESAALEIASVNYGAAVGVGIHLAARMRRQGHGVIVAISSVAGERVRRSNFVYGSSKAGMDGFYSGLGEALRGAGPRVMVVRPGFVHSRMTAGLDAAPMAVTPEQVADAVLRGVAQGKDLVWVPGALRWVMSGLRHVPRPLFRRLPL